MNFRLNVVVITRCMDDWARSVANNCKEADRVFIVPGPYFSEPKRIPYTKEEYDAFDKTLDKNAQTIRMYGYWKHPGEKMNLPLHYASMERDDWFLYLYEGNSFKVTKEFKDYIEMVASNNPSSAEIILPTVNHYQDYIVTPGQIGWPIFNQNLIRFQEGLHLRTHRNFINSMGINIKDDPSAQMYRIYCENNIHYIDNYRMRTDLFDKEYEQFYEVAFGEDYNLKVQPEKFTGDIYQSNNQLSKSLKVRRIQCK